jgi:hypothetical protein
MTAPADAISTPRHSVCAGSPAALLAVVPHLLGFIPRSSLVVVGTGLPGGQVKVTMRYDLPDPADPELASDIAGHATAVLAGQQLSTAVAIGYGPGHLVTPLAGALLEAADRACITLHDVLRAEDGRYWSYTCPGTACCPAEGTPFDVTTHPASAALACGATVLPDRDAVAAGIAPLAAAAGPMRAATRRAEQHITQVIAKAGTATRLGTTRRMITTEALAAVAGIIKAYRDGGSYRTDYQLAWLTVVLRDLRVRDDAWARMDPRHNGAHTRLWTDLVRRACPGYVAPAASLLAFTAWQAGNGVLANLALDRALADDPDYSMAKLLRQVIAAGAPPSLARVPMTPEEVADAYENGDADADGPDGDGEEENEVTEEDRAVSAS